MSQELQDLCVPHLDYLTKKIRDAGYHGSRGGDMFSEHLRPGNYFEAVAVGVSRGCQLLPHMDRANDVREGFDVMGALTYTGEDAKGPYRVGIFGYTRKCVGDFLDSQA